MKSILSIVVIIIIIGALVLAFRPKSDVTTVPPQNTVETPVTVTPITHATAILRWATSTIYTDPTGGASAFAGKAPANIVLITDIHGDHLSTSTLASIFGTSTGTSSPALIVPRAVRDLLPPSLASRATVLANGSSTSIHGFQITAVPMYNLPSGTTTPRHEKGRGNGYIVERDGYRVYIAGDTAGTPEMRALRDIDMAFVPMNLPFTMDVDEAADAVLDFKPDIVYPYHYRGQAGLSDINKFKQLVNAGDSSIDVRLLNWYPAQ
jgi:L-ascorbate metabolism protein UlaG (beta-lactamase superfamily)